MKILTFLTNIDQTKGGPSRSVPMFVRGLALEGVNITLMVVKSNDMNLHALEGTSAKVHLLNPGYSKRDLENYVAQEKFDVIHGQCIWEPLFHKMRLIAEKYNIPFILTPRGTLEPWSLQQKYWKKRIARWLYQDDDLKRCACIYTTAEMEAQHIRELGFKNPLCIIPNGIETERYPCRTDMTKVKKQVLFISRLHYKKGIEILIEAWARIRIQYPDWILTIVGNGDPEYISYLRQLLIYKGLKGYAQIHDPVFGVEKINLYQESAIFCLPSYSENFGMVIAEALSCGVPAITTNGTPWQLLNGDVSTMGVKVSERTGWCIELSVENLKRVLLNAMSMDSAELFEMGQKGSKMIYDNFNYKSVAKKNKQLYEWVISKGSKPSFVDLKI